jgi:hypothetical protein
VNTLGIEIEMVCGRSLRSRRLRDVINGGACNVRSISEGALAAGVDLEENEEVGTKMRQSASQR